MVELSPDKARVLFVEYGGWFGPPALLRGPPNQISPQRDDHFHYIIDGRKRVRALGLLGAQWCNEWAQGKFDHLVFPLNKGGLYSDGKRRLLPRCLALAGHYDRAFEHTPPEWKLDVKVISMFLSLPLTEAMHVWAARYHNSKPKRYARQRHRDNEKLIARIRSLLDAHYEGEIELSIDEIRDTLQ